MPKITNLILQDGGKFYDYDGGLLMFESKLHVKDFDLETAKLARNEFLEWCKQRNLVVRFSI